MYFLQSLTTWDSGNQLTYPVKYIGIGYDDHQGPKDDEAEETGYSVKSDKDSDVIDYPQKDSPDVWNAYYYLFTYLLTGLQPKSIIRQSINSK